MNDLTNIDNDVVAELVQHGLHNLRHPLPTKPLDNRDHR
jgi:hypothetical protein